MILRVLLLIAVAIVAVTCGRGTRVAPRLPDQSAMRDLENAALVVVAQVDTIDDTEKRRGPAGFRPVRVNVSVQHVLKGAVASQRLCFVYCFPYGGYDGPGSVWVQPNMTGVLTLVPDGRCFRAVNDRRAIIPSYREPKDLSMPLNTLVAEATLPSVKGGKCNLHDVTADIWSITIPLIGSRATWRLLEQQLTEPDLNARACACVVMARVWMVNLPCLTDRSTDVIDRVQLDSIRSMNRTGLQREQGWFRSDPVGWLKITISGSGMDGAVLRLAELLSAGAVHVSQPTCAAFLQSLRSGDLNASLAASSTRFNEVADREAKRELDQWLQSGCPEPYGRLAGKPEADLQSPRQRSATPPERTAVLPGKSESR
jgi:hypothetical protein